MLTAMKKDFITAYTWMYGSTKKQAEGAYRRAMEVADYRYVNEIIDCFKSNAKNSFYND